MAVSLRHRFQSAKSDGPDPTRVQPSAWNDEHNLTMSSGFVLGRSAVGNGPVQELQASSAGLALLRASSSEQRDLIGGASVLSSDRTYYVREDGDDGNDGLDDSEIGAFATIQAAIDAVSKLVFGDYNVTISIGAGTFEAAQNIIAFPLPIDTETASPKLKIEGAGSDTVIDAYGRGCFIAVQSAVLVRSLKVQQSLDLPDIGDITDIGDFLTIPDLEGLSPDQFTNLGCIVAEAGGYVQFEDIEFGDAVSHITATNGGIVSCVGDYSVSGSAYTHAFANHGGMIFNYHGDVELFDVPSFYVYALSILQGIIESTVAITGDATGIRLAVAFNSIINTYFASEDYFPGDADGIEESGGLWI